MTNSEKESPPPSRVVSQNAEEKRENASENLEVKSLLSLDDISLIYEALGWE